MLRFLFAIPILAALAGAQTLSEVGGAAAGGAIGTAAGKKVSEGITAIFGKVDTTAKKAAKSDEKKEPMLDVGEGTVVTKAPIFSGTAVGGDESVPPPPPPSGYRRAAPKAAAEAPMPAILPPPPPPPPPPPQVTAQDLRKVTAGMKRDELLRIGAPAARITMDDEGHLLETYSYWAKDVTIGRVKLTDGTVSTVEVFQ